MLVDVHDIGRQRDAIQSPASCATMISYPYEKVVPGRTGHPPNTIDQQMGYFRGNC